MLLTTNQLQNGLHSLNIILQYEYDSEIDLEILPDKIKTYTQFLQEYNYLDNEYTILLYNMYLSISTKYIKKYKLFDEQQYIYTQLKNNNNEIKPSSILFCNINELLSNNPDFWSTI